MRFSGISAVFIAIISSTLLVGCSSSGSGGGSVSGCVPVPDGSVAWTYEECGPLHTGDFIQFHMDQVGQVPSSLKPGDWTDEQLGSRSVNKGHLTFTYQYLDWMDLPWPPNDTILVAFFTQSENYQNLDSWQIVLIRYALDGNVMTRLASQRDDGICEGQVTRDCKKVDDKYDTPLYQVGSTYKFDCTWDTTIPSLWGEQGPGIVDGRIECNIYDGETLVNTSWVPTSGRYALFDTFLVGGRISQVVGKPDAILYSTLTNVRLTVFND